jgi:hypothetical protein
MTSNFFFSILIIKDNESFIYFRVNNILFSNENEQHSDLLSVTNH